MGVRGGGQGTRAPFSNHSILPSLLPPVRTDKKKSPAPVLPAGPFEGSAEVVPPQTSKRRLRVLLSPSNSHAAHPQPALLSAAFKASSSRCRPRPSLGTCVRVSVCAGGGVPYQPRQAPGGPIAPTVPPVPLPQPRRPRDLAPACQPCLQSPATRPL